MSNFLLNFFIKNKIDNTKKSQKKAYTLIELSIVILIISILASGAFSMLSGSTYKTKTSTTSQKLQEIYKSIGVYLMVNKRLPCPAAINLPKNTNQNYGQEVGAGTGCVGAGVYQSATHINLFIGMVPISALNLGSDYGHDDFGNNFTYVVDRRFTYNPPATSVESPADSFGTTTPNNDLISVQERQTVSSISTINSDVILAIISHGANGFGAFNAEIATQNTASTDVDEQSNYLASINNAPSPPTASFDNSIVNNSNSSQLFDDIVLYKTRLDFVNDFNAQRLIACKGSLITDTDFPKKTLYYGQYLYANSACASSNSNIKIIKCNFSGEWQNIVNVCP